MVLRVWIDAVSKLGLRIEPFHLFMEGLDRAEPPDFPAGLGDLEVSLLGREHMAELGLMPGRDLAEADLQARLASGQMCLGARHRGSVVAFTWCNLRQCMIEGHPLFELRDDEASLFDAYTVEVFRGRDLARWMRYRCYEELAKMGRHRCYSVTIIFNTPAVRFKEKLGAKVIGRGVYVDLLARSQFHFGAERPG